MAQPSVAGGLSPAVLWTYRRAEPAYQTLTADVLFCTSGGCFCYKGAWLCITAVLICCDAQDFQLLPECAQLLLAVQDGQRRNKGAGMRAPLGCQGLW